MEQNVTVDPILNESSTDARPRGRKPVVRAVKPVDSTSAEQPLFSPYAWRGVPGFRCNQCSDFYEKRDDVVMHVLKHVPADRRDDVLETLMKEE